MNKRLSLFILAAGALACGSAWAAPAKKRAKPVPAQPAEAADEANLGEGKNVDKKRFEVYLKERIKKIKDAHQARLDFFNKEQDVWTSFWNKVRDERQQFEIRITRQTLDLFESLASLDQKDYPQTIANFEKLQNDVIKAFESQQKSKMAEFFTARDARWKEFAVDQEKERSDFVADAEQSWQDNKKSLKDPESSVVTSEAEKPAAKPAKTAKPAKAAAASGDDEDRQQSASDDSSDAEAAPAEEAKPTPKPKPAKKSTPNNAEDKWH